MQVVNLPPRDKLPTMPTPEKLRQEVNHTIEKVEGAKAPSGPKYSVGDYFNMGIAWLRSFTMQKMGLIPGTNWTLILIVGAVILVALLLLKVF